MAQRWVREQITHGAHWRSEQRARVARSGEVSLWLCSLGLTYGAPRLWEASRGLRCGRCTMKWWGAAPACRHARFSWNWAVGRWLAEAMNQELPICSRVRLLVSIAADRPGAYFQVHWVYMQLGFPASTLAGTFNWWKYQETTWKVRFVCGVFWGSNSCDHYLRA